MNTLRHTTIIAALLCGSMAQADVTAQQVWDNWTDQMKVYGQGFSTGDEVMSGDTLTISDVMIEMSDDEAAVTAELGEIALTENGDGTVSITVPDSYPITLDMTPDFGEPTTLNLIVEHDAMTLLVSGDPDAMAYDITADRYAISIDSIDGQGADEVDLQAATVAMIDIAGQYKVTASDLTRIAYTFDMGALDLNVAFSEVGGGNFVEGNADLSDLSMFANIAAPLDMDMSAPEPPFDKGLAMDGGYTFGALSYDFDFAADGEAMSGDISVDGGELALAIDIDGASYSGTSRGIVASLMIPNEVPFPLDATMGQYGFDFQIPLSQSEDGPRDARMAFNFTDLAVSDTIWNLLDPQNILPRDPVTIALGLDATATPFFDFLDPAQQEAAAMTSVPGEINSAEITELTVRGGGAEITGGGAFTFDNSDLQTFDGFPRPMGQATFNINGINGLIDNLIQMGLIPQEEAMMPRMMMGMFTTPVGDDQLTSTIEVNAEGHVLANGQRLR